MIGGRIADQFSGQTYFFFVSTSDPAVVMELPEVGVVTSILPRARKRTGVATADTRRW